MQSSEDRNRNEIWYSSQESYVKSILVMQMFSKISDIWLKQNSGKQVKSIKQELKLELSINFY